MGSIWLDGSTPGYPNVLTVLRNAGVPVQPYAGWERNSRSSGGFNQLMVIYNHHTASQTSPANDVSYCMNGPDNPIANCLLDRTGLLHLYAGGASNHAGKGGGSDSRPPWVSSRGPVPVDAGNSNGWGLEIANNGVGEPYPKPQQDSAALINRALCDAYGMVPAMDCPSHFEWTDRKCDPTGASRWTPPGNRLGCNGADRWDMNQFRNEIAGTLPAPIPPTPGDDDEMPKPFMATLIQCTGKDGTLTGAVYVTDQIGLTVRWIPDSQSLGDLQYALRVAGLSDAIQTVDNRDAFGVLVGREPGS